MFKFYKGLGVNEGFFLKGELLFIKEGMTLMKERKKLGFLLSFSY